MPFAWNDRLSVHVPLIDAQHKEIVRRAGAFLEAMEERRGAAELEKLLHWLRAYVQTHFADEEALMNGCGYPGGAAHAQEHQELTGRVLELSRRLHDQGATPIVAVEANELVCHWFFEHIGGSDAALAEFIRATSPRTVPGQTR
jgi:hemerythrin